MTAALFRCVQVQVVGRLFESCSKYIMLFIITDTNHTMETGDLLLATDNCLETSVTIIWFTSWCYAEL